MKKAYGSGNYGEWIVDGFGSPAFLYANEQMSNPGLTITGKEEPDHCFSVGNDRITGVAYNYGYVQVRQDEGGPKFLNDFYPEKNQYSGGFGYLVGGNDLLLSTFYNGDNKNFKRIFGIGYAQKTVKGENYTVDQTVFAPFGDDPIMISKVSITNHSDETADLSWFEYWSCDLFHFLMMPMTADEKPSWEQQRDFNKGFQNTFLLIDGNKGLLKSMKYTAGPAVSPDTPAKMDYNPPETFLISLDAPADRAMNDCKTFFGEGGVHNPAGLNIKKEVSTELSGDESMLLLERKLQLEPGETKVLYFAYGYVPEGFDRNELIQKYSVGYDNLLSDTAEQWKNDLLLLSVPNEPHIERELTWHNYYLRSGMSYDSWFGEHIISENAWYQYVMGIQGPTRDPLQNALPFIYTQPWIMKEILRYTLKELLPNGELPYVVSGNGLLAEFPMDACDFPAFLIWSFSEYILATKDYAFLDEKISPYPIDGIKQEPESVKVLVERCYHFMVREIGFGRHGLMRVNGNDWNDGLVANFIDFDKHGELKEQGETVLTSAMAVYVLEKYASIMEEIEEENFALEVKQVAEQFRSAVKEHWTGEWFKRLYITDELGWFGEDVLWLEPQPWAIISGCTTKEQTQILTENIDRLLRQPSKIGAMLDSEPLDGVMFDRGTFINGGVWFAINGTLIWALAACNGEMAWDEWKKTMFFTHAEAYPDIWVGTVTAADCYSSELSEKPGMSCDTAAPVPEFPYFCSHAHSWQMFDSVKLCGFDFLADGLQIRPMIPKEEYALTAPVISLVKSRTGYSGHYAPIGSGKWNVSIALPKEEITKVTQLVVNGEDQAVEILEGSIRFSGESTPVKPLEWSLSFR